ncbi:MAG: RNA methyltransferase [Bacteroidales bacterium]|nr:RNA methyltransferase [Bacteroidales bacterium]
MLSKNKEKFILSLKKKKVREELKLFIVEGDKMVKEFIASGMKLVYLVAKAEFISGLNKEQLASIGNVIPASFDELRRISSLKTPHNAVAVVEMPEMKYEPEKILTEQCIALDFIQDPGNLGTIIRSAAWFGFRNIVCSHSCVDVYNPKVIQATMGAILNVNVLYADLEEFLNSAVNYGVPIYGTFPDGESIYSSRLDEKGVILLGNESKGISQELLPFVSYRLSIPRFTNSKRGIESLNAAMAASIVFSEFARRRREVIDDG